MGTNDHSTASWKATAVGIGIRVSGSTCELFDKRQTSVLQASFSFQYLTKSSCASTWFVKERDNEKDCDTYVICVFLNKDGPNSESGREIFSDPCAQNSARARDTCRELIPGCALPHTCATCDPLWEYSHSSCSPM